jgi:S-sulfo-L-cysteine synthase (O-acetyl-L-serine-dependent)
MVEMALTEIVIGKQRHAQRLAASVQVAPVRSVSILNHVGNTPLLDLSALAHSDGVPATMSVYAKAEWFNPGGSVKDRPALRIIEEAEASGALTPDRVLIDSTSGNTGIAYAMIGAARGYQVHLVMPANVSAERKALARAYGAKLIETDPLEGADGAIRAVRKMVAAEPARYFYADQYNNPANWMAHYEMTGPEIWRQTGGQVTHYVAGLGTTGTFTGVGRYLKTVNPLVRLVAVQPEDELQVIEGLKHLETAIVPGIYDPTLPDVQVHVAAETAWEMARRLAREAGLHVGLSAGAAWAATLETARGLDSGVVVTLFPDGGAKYLSLGLFDEED